MRRALVVMAVPTLASGSASQATVAKGNEWIVMTGPDWLHCRYPDLRSKRVKTLAQLPFNVPFNPVR